MIGDLRFGTSWVDGRAGAESKPRGTKVAGWRERRAFNDLRRYGNVRGLHAFCGLHILIWYVFSEQLHHARESGLCKGQSVLHLLPRA